MCQTRVHCVSVIVLAVATGIASSADGEKSLAEKLDRPVTVDTGGGPKAAVTPLQDALEYLSDRFELPIWIDREAFRKQHMDSMGDVPVRLKKMHKVRSGTVLQSLLSQIGAEYVIRNNRLEIVPAPKEARPASRPSARQLQAERDLRRKLAEVVTIENMIPAGTELEEALDTFADRFHLNIAVDDYAFHRAGKERLDRTKKLPPLPKMKDVLLRAVLDELLKDLGATYRIEDNLIIVVPRGRRTSSDSSRCAGCGPSRC